jgi:hypothetical protein
MARGIRGVVVTVGVSVSEGVRVIEGVTDIVGVCDIVGVDVIVGVFIESSSRKEIVDYRFSVVIQKKCDSDE